MATIREYNAPAQAEFQGFRPTSMGDDALVQGARRVGALNNEAGTAIAGGVSTLARTGAQITDDYYSRQEATQFGKDSIAVMDSIASQWNTARNTADPNDPNVAQKFNEEVLNPALESFGQHYISSTGQDLAQQFKMSFARTMAQTQRADAMTAAGVAVHNNIVDMTNTSADLLTRNPGMLEAVNATNAQAIEGYISKNPNLSSEKVAQIREMLPTMRRSNTLAAFDAKARANPAGALADLKAGFGKDDLTQADRETLENHANNYQKLAEADTRSAQERLEKQQREDADTAGNKIFVSALQADGSFVPGPDYYSNITKLTAMPNAPPGLAKSLYEDGVEGSRRLAEGKPAINDPHTVDDLSTRLLLNPDDPNKLELKDIVAAHVQGRLSDKTAGQLTQDFNELQRNPGKKVALQALKNFQNGLRSSITASNMMSAKDPEGDQRFLQWTTLSSQMFNQIYDSGGDWRAAADINNPNSLARTASPYMIGTKAGMQEAQSNIQKGVTLVPPINPSGTPKAEFVRKPGETPEQALKRKNGG